MLNVRTRDTVSLLTKQLSALQLPISSKPTQTRNATRTQPRGWRMPDYRSFRHRFWTRAKTFPPNWAEDHHLHFPSLREQIKARENDEQIFKVVNIGEKTLESSKSVKPSESRRNRRAKAYEKNQVTDEVLQSVLENDAIKTELNYEKFIQRTAQSSRGWQETMNLARHYQLYRDLFPTIEGELGGQILPKVDFGDYYPRPEYIYPETLEKYYPGAVRGNTQTPTTLLYEFLPKVPIHAEFAVPSLEGATDEFDISTVYRGNIIEPRFANARPNVVIDNSIYSSKPTEKLYSEQVTDGVRLLGNDPNHYTLALLSLDNLTNDKTPICHWMVTNMNASEKPQGEETHSFLPVYGVNGLGFHRYAFLLLRHDAPIEVKSVNSVSLKERALDLTALINTNSMAKLRPVGLSWFQTRFDETCKDIFHNVLGMRMPVYEYIQPPMRLNKQVKFPGHAPFNLYLDHFRDQKEIAAEVLSERLESINPFNYHEQIQPRKLSPNIYKYSHDTPSWLRTTIWKRRNMYGVFRNLRPSSALQPLNNNADLDQLDFVRGSRLEVAMRYPFGKRSPKPLTRSQWRKPLNKHPNLRYHAINGLRSKNYRDKVEFDEEKALVQSASTQ